MKVLFIGNSESEGMKVREMLRFAFTGCDVFLISHPEAVLQIVGKDCPDLVLIDASFAGGSGFEWCLRFRERFVESFVPVLILAAQGVSLDDRIRAFEAGACGMVSRPLSEVVFANSLAPLMGMDWLMRGRMGEYGTGVSQRKLEVGLRFRFLFDESPDPVVLVGEGGVIECVNPAGAFLLGRSFQDTVTRRLEEVVYHENRQRVAQWCDRLFHSGEVAPEVGMVFEAGESGISISIPSVHRVRFKDGAYRVLHLRDESPPRQVAEALRESRTRAEAVLNTVVDGVITVDEKGIIQSYNSSASRMFGYTTEEMLGKPVETLMPEPYCRHHHEYMQRYMETGERHIIGTGREVLGKRKDGTVFPIELAVSEVFLGNRKLFTGLVRDISERKRNEFERDRLAAIIEQTQEVVIVTDTTGNILYVNPAFERGMGYSREEVLGKNPRIFGSRSHAKEIFKELWDTITRGEVWRGLIVNRRKNGSLIDVRQTIGPIKDREGAIVNYVSIWQDVTRERHLEEQVRQTQKLEGIGRLAGGIVHDFNNVLSAILGYGQILKDRVDGLQVAELLEEIISSAERGTRLTRQLLAFCRRQPVRMRMVDLNEVVRNMDQLLRRTVGDQVEVISDCGEDLGFVMADFGQMEQVIMNLAVNARDAMEQSNGKLTIRTYTRRLTEESTPKWENAKPGDYVVLSICDTGVGMSREVCEHVFEPFFTTKEEGKGTGLGLSVVYGIVKQHGGWIELTSEVGRGSEFRIFLPRLESQEKRQSIFKEEENPGGQETLLLVEDDPQVRTSMKMILESLGYTVHTAGSGQDAQELARELERPLDGVVCDFVMPRMNGPETVKRLKEIFPEVKVVFLSGFADGYDGEVDGHVLLRKPIARSRLALALRKVLDVGT